jgi:DNA modification methylase
MDLLKLNGADTTYSEFGQKPESFEELIKRYSRPGDLVVDPFCGGGAVPEACQRHGRRCLASELDVSTFEGLVSRFFGCAPEKVRNSGKTKWGCVAAARTVPSTK